jgi:Glycosyl hydrolase 108/Predicted Peptidoglycan domain
MAYFLPAFENTMGYEDSKPSGRVTAEPEGAKARFGVNSKAHPEMPPSFWTDPPETAIEQAKAVYHSGYWNPLLLDGLLNQDLANKMFDMAINMGVREGAILAQRAAVALGANITVDGVIGPATLQALNCLAPADVHAKLRMLSVAYYQHIEQIHPADAKWDGAWMARAEA